MLPPIPFHSQQSRTHFALCSVNNNPIDPMAGFKLLKRKGVVDEIRDDFSDFSLSSPATKIRRLDCGLPPIVEEDESLTVAPPPAHANEERALVLFKPIQHHSPSSFSLSLNSDLISQFKKSNQFGWSKECDYDRLIRSREEEEEKDNNNSHGLAIVPWVPQAQQQQQQPPSASVSSSYFYDNNNAELMEADETEEGTMMMDVEEEQQATASLTSTFQHPIAMPMAEGFHHQQQQHCLLPQLPQNTSTPITWTWTQ